jgi:ABC-type uncharacterized transport system substrate-binding protein
MNRRAFLSSITVGLLAGPLAAEAQPAGNTVRIGRLSPVSPSVDAPTLQAFRQGLRELGWVEGRNLVIESRFADGNVDRLSALATELVRSNVDLIVGSSTLGALAAKHATSTIPIVVTTTGDPVASGLVASLARPGGNLTGVTALALTLSEKQLELLKEAAPGVKRIAVLRYPASGETGSAVRKMEAAAPALGVQLRVMEVSEPAGIEKAFTTMRTDRVGALAVLSDPMLYTNRKRIVELAAQHRLPTMYAIEGYIDVGGLMFYGESLPAMHRRAAHLVDKILKGAKPGELPVEQPTKFELVINLKTAKALGLTIPQSLLLRADQVIE